MLLSVLLMIGVFGCNAQDQQKEEEIRSKINTEFSLNIRECNIGTDAVTDFNGKVEFWNVCNLKNGNRIILIESYNEVTYYQEVYFEKNSELIYAKETENFMPKNHFTQMNWNCEYYAKKGELIALMSLGHGKTENDQWDPDIIFEMYENRLSELKKIIE